MVLWFCFFPSWFDLGVKHGKIKHRISEIFSYQCQGHALVSVKAIGFPVFLKENISQIQLVIAQGKHTNIDPEKLVLYQASKSEKRILIFFQLYLGFPWGWILPPSLETPELKEFIFEKVKHSESKRKCQSSSRVFVCQIVLDDHGFVVLLFLKLSRFRGKTRAVWEAVKSKLNSQLQKRIRRQRPIECRIVKINGSQMKTWKRRGSGGNHTTNSSCMSVQNPKTRDEILTEKNPISSRPIGADWSDCRFWMFWKILDADYVEHVYLKRFERGGGWGIGKKCFNIYSHSDKTNSRWSGWCNPRG